MDIADPKNPGDLLRCEKCDAAAHFCHPYDSTYESGVWVCSTCQSCGTTIKIAKIKDVDFTVRKNYSDYKTFTIKDLENFIRTRK